MKKHKDISRFEFKEWLTSDSGQAPNLEEVLQAEDTMLAFVEAHSIAPPPFLKDKILQKINQLKEMQLQHQKLDLDKLPMLADNTNWLDWQAAIEGIQPPAEFENIHLHTIESNEKRELFVAWVKEMVEEEVHHDLLESFLILEGSCECHITDEKGGCRIVRLSQGDFITMQLGETHDIVITSLRPTKAILEWRKLAA